MTFTIPRFEVSEEFAISQARLHRAEAVGYERRMMEARRDVDEARGNSGPRLNLYAIYGWSQTTPDLESIFDRGEEYQQVSLAMDLPILDWGRAESRRRMAESNRSVIEQTIAQQRADLDHGVAMKVKQFLVQRERIELAAKADEIADKRFGAARQRSILGRGDMTSFTLASVEREAARRRYVAALRDYWVASSSCAGPRTSTSRPIRPSSRARSIGERLRGDPLDQTRAPIRSLAWPVASTMLASFSRDSSQVRVFRPQSGTTVICSGLR